MPSSDYGNAIKGGLKLKGTKDSSIKKSKKKKTKPAEAPVKADKTTASASGIQNALAEEEENLEDNVKTQENESSEFGKTEAQRRHEERRRKRLDDRLKREGIKTHKERVEELNKYLSGLSEHHDMPRIGPG